jgi:hypothetical protein
MTRASVESSWIHDEAVESCKIMLYEAQDQDDA